VVDEFVRLKLAGVETPGAVAVTMYGPPTVALAVKTDEVALPVESVVSVSVAVPFKNVPLAELAGAVNVTVTPLTAFEELSSTVATNGAGNGVLMSVLCGVPLVAVIVPAEPPMLVRLKFAGVVTPLTVAVTV
jgi:hypothetical protein